MPVAKAVEIRPDYAVAQDSPGKVLDRVGRVNEAIREFRGVLKLKPDHGEARSGVRHTLALHEKLAGPHAGSAKP